MREKIIFSAHPIHRVNAGLQKKKGQKTMEIKVQDRRRNPNHRKKKQGGDEEKAVLTMKKTLSYRGGKRNQKSVGKGETGERTEEGGSIDAPLEQQKKKACPAPLQRREKKGKKGAA